jgi:hypothetical protein
VTNNS